MIYKPLWVGNQDYLAKRHITLLQEDGASLGLECTGRGLRARSAYPPECCVVPNMYDLQTFPMHFYLDMEHGSERLVSAFLSPSHETYPADQKARKNINKGG